MNAFGIIFANIHDNNLPEMTMRRTIGSVPFGCRYRLIDFTLSNMVNSNINITLRKLSKHTLNIMMLSFKLQWTKQTKI